MGLCASDLLTSTSVKFVALATCVRVYVRVRPALLLARRGFFPFVSERPASVGWGREETPGFHRGFLSMIRST